uniref:Uncharacterized protein n=1 Tax=Manihot esculenta TaxID=3983 RepID=A0A2C9V1Y6_MANES
MDCERTNGSCLELSSSATGTRALFFNSSSWRLKRHHSANKQFLCFTLFAD